MTSLPLTVQTPRDIPAVHDKSFVGPTAAGVQITGVVEQSLQSLSENLNQHIDAVTKRVGDQPLISIDSEYGSVQSEAGLHRLIESLSTNIIPSLNYTRAGFCILLQGGPSTESAQDNIGAEHQISTYQKLLDEITGG